MCLGFVHIPDIGPIPLQIIEKKNVNAVRLTLRRSLAKPHEHPARPACLPGGEVQWPGVRGVRPAVQHGRMPRVGGTDEAFICL